MSSERGAAVTAATVSARVVGRLIDVGVNAGIRRDILMDAARVSSQDLHDCDARVLLASEIALWQTLAKHISDPEFGIRGGQAFRLGLMGLVGYVARFSATLRGALHRVQRYGRLFTEAVEFRLEEGQREVALAMPHPALGPGRAVAEGYRINEITAAIDWNQRCDWIVRRLAAQTPAAKVWEDSMLITIVDNHVYVRLSRRNLRQLDAILDEPDVRNRCLVRKDENGTSLVLQVEDDADHYMGRDPGPGYGDVASHRQEASLL